MTNTRVTAALDALKPAVRNNDGEAAAKVLADLAKTDPGAATQIREGLIVKGLQRLGVG